MRSKWGMEQVFSELRTLFNVDQSEPLGTLKSHPAIVALAKKSGWKVDSLITALDTGMYLEDFDEVRPDPVDNVAAYYERRDREDRDSTRSASGFDSRGDPCELDFN